MARALLVVDVQNDFCEGGSLAVAGGAAVAGAVTSYLRSCSDGAYAEVVASRDWHTSGDANGGHFAAPDTAPDFASTWPVHCVAGTGGAAYHPAWDATLATAHVVKGMGVPAYSMFEGVLSDLDGEVRQPFESLAELIRGRGIDAVDVVGIATDYCVRQTALDAAFHGLWVRVLVDLTAAVAAESRAAALREFAAAGVEVS